MRVLLTATCLCICVVAAPQAARSQSAPTGTLQVTVVDTTGAVLVGATVTVVGVDAANKGVAPTPVVTSAQGVASIPRLAPGRYSVQAESGGFETRTLPDVRVRSGDNRQVVILQVEGHKEAVVVEQNRQQAAADPRGPSFGTTLTREQLEALSDDPNVLRQQLQDMAGPGAVISVDSFEGGALPPKAQIRSIRISRDQFAAEYHSAGGTQIEIITQPGLGPIRMNFGTRLRGGSLSGRNPFTGVTSPEQNRNFFLGGGGTLVKNKSSFNLFVNTNNSYETPNRNVALANGTQRSEPLPIRSPRDNVSVFGQVDYALTLDQTLRFGFNLNNNKNRNQGIGQFDELERAFSTDSDNGSVRAQHISPLGRRAFTRSRVQYSWSNSDSVSAVEAPTIRVNDAFTRGGAQVAGGQHSRTFTFASDLDYVRGIHTWRTGLLIDAGRWHSNDTANYLGTYTFESLDAFTAGLPRSYTRRIGDPNLRYQNLQGALYLQDDLRVRRNLTLSAGLRYEAQTHVSDFNNLEPRFGVTWAPFAQGQTTLRSSWGLFYDWLQTSTYEQTLRVDGFRQRELDIQNPPFPDLLGLAGTAPPINRYLFGGDFALPRSNRWSVGIDQRVRKIQASATFAYTRGSALARGQNLNAPVVGARPDPTFGNIVEVQSDANSRLRQLQVNVTANPGALLPLNNAPRVKWSRVTVFFNYTWATLRNNTDGAFFLPPSGLLSDEWGPAPADVRHRLNMTVNNQIVKNFGVSLGMNATSAPPFSVRTGRDDNGDLVYNDRPAGVGRNSERGTGQLTLNLGLNYSWAFGKSPGNTPPGIAVIGGGGSVSVQTFDQGPRYRLGFFVFAQNLTNRDNYVGYVGTLTSPFYGRPTNVSGTRKIDAGFNLNF